MSQLFDPYLVFEDLVRYWKGAHHQQYQLIQVVEPGPFEVVRQIP